MADEKKPNANPLDKIKRILRAQANAEVELDGDEFIFGSKRIAKGRWEVYAQLFRGNQQIAHGGVEITYEDESEPTHDAIASALCEEAVRAVQRRIAEISAAVDE